MATVKPTIQKYEAGDIIFREGEPSAMAFIVAAGEVALFKESERGLIHLATVGKGELLGEMGAIDTDPRGATAVARGPVTLHAYGRKAFVRRLEDDPDLALRLMVRLSRRLRNANERIARLEPVADVTPEGRSGDESGTSTALVPVTAAAVGGMADGGGGGGASGGGGARGDGLLGRLIGVLKGGSGPKTAESALAGAARVRHPVLAVAGFPERGGEEQRVRVLEALEGLAAVRLRKLDRAVPYSAELDPYTALSGAIGAGRPMLREVGADLLVWGGPDASGRLVELRFLSPWGSTEIERIGMMSPQNALYVPVDFDPSWHVLIQAVTLAAMEPRSEAQGRALVETLPPLAEAAGALLSELPYGLSGLETAQIVGCYGNVLAMVGAWANEPAWLEHAAAAYEEAIRHLPRDADAEWGVLHRSLGLVWQALVERNHPTIGPRQAADAFKAALESFHRDLYPYDWAGLKSRLGLLCYRIHMAEGDPAALRDSINAFQAALQVFSPADTPDRWGEIMHDLAQVLQVYGGQERKPEILTRAVEAANAALQVRPLDRVPLLWAATQNNLGSALFLLFRVTKDAGALHRAREAFHLSAGTYEVQGAKRQADIVARNLRRVENLIDRQGGASAPDPAWARGDGGGAVPPDASDGPEALPLDGGLR
ncbi:Crp/Fnr family transcriptional regulator [Roseospira marina]|nr:cyclic nucleotide-binding domain-containing protein [Roseospira marina]MBB4315141.1 CRP-like cAMP-binding protein/tetratricopeptide (TPR) repeat protein [Roseospira marina]MBB5088089.1 CRP-like cAMP-binding protein/tetratricopeptide (TPR) repeat protein [Roseospira marina]